MEKKFFFKIIGIIVAVVTAMAGIVIWIDPFYHYHKPLSYISYVSGADVYSNDGKLKHFDYDTLTIGTSMAMNFRKEKVDTILGGNSLNVYYLGEGFKVINEGLETALETHPDLKLVVRTVDTTWFVSAVNWEGRESYPEYLYDKNPFNDVYYIYNKDVWKDNLIPSIVQSFKNGFQGEVKQEGFGSRGLTGKENVLKNYKRPEKEIKEVTQEETEDFLNYLEENLNVNVLQVIKDYPDVETKIRDAITSKGFGLGKVIYAKGNSTSIIAILTVVKSNQIQYPYLYGALLDITLRAFQAKAFIVMTEPYMKQSNNQWSKIKPMLSRCIEITQKSSADTKTFDAPTKVTAIVQVPKSY